MTTPGMSEESMCESCKNGKPCYSFSCGAINSREAELASEREKSKATDSKLQQAFASIEQWRLAFKLKEEALEEKDEQARLREIDCSNLETALESSRQEIERLKDLNRQAKEVLEKTLDCEASACVARNRLEKELEAERQSTRELLAALDKIASWGKGGQVNSSFDCPFHATIAREAIARHKAGGKAS